MKDNLIYFLIISSITITISATAQNRFTFGLMGGVNFSSVNIVDFPDFLGPDVEEGKQWQSGFQGGLTSTYYFNSRFALVANLLFAQKGYKVITRNSSSPMNFFRFEYLTLPLMARFYPINPVFVEGGLAVGYLLNAKIRVDGVTLNSSIYDLEKDFDFGMVVGAGVSVAPKIALQIRYVYSLSSFQEILTITTSTGQTVSAPGGFFLRNQSMQLAINFDLL